jgi:hypothetical protein
VNLDRRLRSLRSLQRLLDEAFHLPGTTLRFGIDPIIGLLPWVGDVLTAVLSCAILMQAHHMGLPRVVQLRMLLNIGIDVLIGVVPLVGDVADVFWKSNTRNLALLETHAAEVRPPSLGDWLFVGGVILTIVAIAALPLVVMYWIVHALMAER